MKAEPFRPNLSKLNQNSQNNSIVDRHNQQALQISHPEINFINTELNELYQISITLRNVTKNSLKIKVKRPASPLLSVLVGKSGLLASGLQLKITIVLDNKQNAVLKDKIVIVSDVCEVQVPVNVYPQVCKLQFEPFVNFGYQKIGSTIQFPWEIVNESEKPTDIRLVPLLAEPNAQLTISDQEFRLEPKEKKIVKLSLTSKVNGNIEGSIQIEPKILGHSTVQFVANFCDFKRMMCDSQGREIKEISLQAMLGGQIKKISTFIVNNTPQFCEYRITRKKGSSGQQMTNLLTPEQIGKDDIEKLVQFQPSQGALASYTTVPLTTTIHAKLEDNDMQLFCNYILGKNVGGQFQKEWNYNIRTYINHEEQFLDLQIKGTSLVPKIGITPTYLAFNDCYIMQKIKKNIKVENFSERTVSIELQHSPNFTLTPQKLKLHPNSSQFVQVCFNPKKIGDLNQMCSLVLGAFSFPIKLFGKCVFGFHKNQTENSCCEEVPIQNFEKSCLEEQISSICKGKNHTLVSNQNSKSRIHFDTYRIAAQGLNRNQSNPLVENLKRTKILRNKNGKQVKVDVNHLNANQTIDVYGGLAKNQLQERLIARQLSSEEFKNIAVGPVVIEMGTIFLRSCKRKTFNICNFNNKPISIKMQSAHQSFAQTSQQRQILPAQSHGGFYINYEALTQGPFKHTIQYELNANHFFQFMVTGLCIAPLLTLSRHQLKFSITEQDKKFEKTQTLKLENHYEYDTEFEWKLPANSQFSVQPMSGMVKGNSQATSSIVLNYQSLGQGKVQQILKLKLKNGKTMDLKCSGMVPESSCICKSTEMKLQEACIGKQYEQKVHIKNISKLNTIFKLSIPKEYENIIVPSFKNHLVPAEDITEITFKFYSPKVCTLDTKIVVIIRGSKNIELNIKANFVLPNLRVENQLIDFGLTPVEGNSAQKQVMLINDSSMPVDLQLRLHQDTFLYKLLRMNEVRDPNLVIVETKELKAYKAICMRISPKSKCLFALQFTPETTQDYQFYLPLFLPNVEPLDAIQKLCKCTGIKNRLAISEKQINFGKIVIEQIENFYGKNQTLQISNPQEEAISWWIQESNLSPFRLDKCKGKLQAFEKTTIKLYFSAESPGEYNRELQFFIDQADIDISKCYMKIGLIACACYPTLYFDQPYVILPATRVGTQSRATLEIVNGGYENINLKHSISQEYGGAEISVIYSAGSNLGVTKKQLKVQVTAKSQKPISFTFKLNFHDNNNRTFTINVSGTFDTHTFTLIQHERTPHLLEKSCHFLKNYLNSTGHLSQEIYQFPKALIDNQFQNMSVFLTGYSHIFQKVKATIKKNCKSFVAFEYLSEIIKLLKAEGAFLNHIRPQMLLSYEEYLSHLMIRAQNNQLKYSYFNKKDKQAYENQQKYSWLVLFYQIFKVFSRVNPGKLKQNSQFWVKFALRQKILLNWLQKSYESQAKVQVQQKGGILGKLNNGQMLSALISKYTNIKVLQGYGKSVKGLKQKQRRCRAIVETLTQIGITNLLRVQDLLRSSEKEMLLVVQNLYTILPSYLQKGEPIVFTCQFGQVITKSVEVTNPSKYPINYIAKIEGSKAYSIEGEAQFIIQSKKTQEIKIKYVSNVNINNCPATLTLTGKPHNKFTPSTFIFLLKSTILGRISEKNIQVTTNIYEQLDFTIQVPNHLQADGQFKVEQQAPKSLHQSFYLLSSTIKIKKGQSGVLNMVFLPMLLETQTAILLFRDERVGEFQYELTGLVQANVLCQEPLRIPHNIYTNKKYQIELQIPLRNDLILRARKAAQFLADKLQRKASNLKDQKSAINYEKYYPKLTNYECYSVKLSNPNSSISIKTQQLSIKDIEAGDDPKREEQKIVFEINLKSSIKEGSFSINLRNAAGSDIRKYKVNLTAVARPLRYELELKTPVSKLITQPLPLINVTNERNLYHISLTPHNEHSKNTFSLDRDREIVIEPKEQSIVTLSFRPKSQHTFNAILKMQNMTTGQNIEYSLVGIGEQPQAEVVLFQQQVRKEKLHTIKLPFLKNSKCSIVSFDLQGVQYQKNFALSAQNQSFKFKFSPKLSGKYQAKLLIETDHTLLSYLVSINVKNIIEGEIKMRTVERKQIQSHILLPAGSYQIRCEDHNLKVPETAVISSENPALSIAYYSSIPEEKEIQLSVVSQQLGQMTYLIKVIVEPMPQIKLESFVIQLGKIHREKICFENTDDCLIKVVSNSTHPHLFYPDFQAIEVPPRSKVEAHIHYKASSLEMEEGKIYFTSNKNAKWIYHLSGYGLAQVKAETQQFAVNVGQQICESIIFRNPLNKTLPFHIMLQNADQGDSAFAAILKSYKVELAYNQELEIPITLNPKCVSLYTALLKILVNEKICWRYELNAQVGYKSSEEIRTFKVQARCKTEQLLEYTLPYAHQYSGEKVRLTIKGISESVVKVKNGGQATINNSKVSFNLNILSFRPKNIPVSMQISKENGCKWMYKCQFAFSAPPIDDKFEIIAAINKPASVKFRLTNSVKSYAKFNAYFTSDSCIDFTVLPKNGELQPYGREGTPLEVVFCPTQYKKSWVGRLIIQTDESYWSYEVKGCLPHYNPPVGKSSFNP